jgi:cell fate (sporulation/competence/biofilm development) regulator YlbF (YheA/YmcA/DUF963 family)
MMAKIDIIAMGNKKAEKDLQNKEDIKRVLKIFENLNKTFQTINESTPDVTPEQVFHLQDTLKDLDDIPELKHLRIFLEKYEQNKVRIEVL